MASDASDSLWQLSQRSSSKLKGLMDGLRRRKRLQNNPLYPAEFQVECPQCVGLGYLGAAETTLSSFFFYLFFVVVLIQGH